VVSEVELRELRYFVAVAEELNFSRAAERLGMAQSPLSKAIAQLEARIGVALLERTTRRVSLTPAGVVLLEQARPALQTVTAAVRRAQRAARLEPVLTVAMKSGGDGGLLREILAAYQAPDRPPVEVLVASWGQPASLVHEGRADVALLRSPFSTRGLEVEELLSEPRMVVLAVGHRLAGRSRLRRADLASEAMPQWPGADEVTAAHWTGRDPASLSAAWPDGTAPPVEVPGPVVSDLDQLLTVVALGQAVAFVPSSTAERHSRTDVVYRPVTDLSPSAVAVAWPEGSRSRAVAAFVRATTQVATRHPDLLDALP
jgi:DNA-binding transcriptional LysR family regulator